MKIIRKSVEKPLEILETDVKYFQDCAKTYLGSETYIESCYIDGTQFIMAVDEDGICKNLPHNFYMRFSNDDFPVQKIVGDALFIRCKPVRPWGEIYDYEVSNITTEDIAWVGSILDDAHQKQLRIDFMEIYKNRAYAPIYRIIHK